MGLRAAGAGVCLASEHWHVKRTLQAWSVRCTGQRRRGRTARSLDPRLHSTVSVRTKKVPFNTHGALLQTCKKRVMISEEMDYRGGRDVDRGRGGRPDRAGWDSSPHGAVEYASAGEGCANGRGWKERRDLRRDRRVRRACKPSCGA